MSEPEVTSCPACGVEAPAGAKFCAACGRSLTPPDPDLDATIDATSTSGASRGTAPVTPLSRVSPASDSGTSTERFPPGTLFAGRYRIVGLLGRGGMGEVVRADDLELDHPVAIKFLPADLAKDPQRLLRFRQEVRLARQISHPNVCRVYDIGEADGHQYLTMEYIDGEDLRSLLRRIGRLPSDKAIEIARQICAGLAASHEKGVLHRDLKPANIMLDGAGKVRITDFGLAALSESIGADEIRSGTPAYMAPEQLAGDAVTIESDVYALGLVLYEIFTGQPTFAADTVVELSRMHAETIPASPTTVVAELDPAVERVILRCLEKDPTERPSSALAVAAALPGGDPLAAALAAGEIPSPEMVAAAGGTSEVPSRYLWLLAPIAVAMVVVAFMTDRWGWESYHASSRPPAVLVDRANEMLDAFGHDADIRATAWGYDRSSSYLRWLSEQDSTSTRWEPLRRTDPPSSQFWYRTSPRGFTPRGATGRVSWSRPAFTTSGMARLALGANGTLRTYQLVPPQLHAAASDSADPFDPMTMAADFGPFFDAARLDIDTFRAVEPRWSPEVFVDDRRAWEGLSVDSTEIRIEAGSFRGKPVYWDTIWPWSTPNRMPGVAGDENPVGVIISISIFLVILVGSAVLARRHIALGKGDRPGATRLASFIFLAGMVNWVLSATHQTSFAPQLNMFFTAVGVSLVGASLTWLFYMALEPYLRRYAPDMLISWVRVLKGRMRDARVARDTLVGLSASLTLDAVVTSLYVGMGTLGRPLAKPFDSSEWFVSSPFLAFARIAGVFAETPTSSLILLLILAAPLIVTKSMRVAVVSMFLFIVTLATFQLKALTGYTDAGFVGAVAIATLMILVMIRYGVWAFVVMSFFNSFLDSTLQSFDFGRWYAFAPAITWACLLGVIGWAVHTMRRDHVSAPRG